MTLYTVRNRAGEVLAEGLTAAVADRLLLRNPGAASGPYQARPVEQVLLPVGPDGMCAACGHEPHQRLTCRGFHQTTAPTAARQRCACGRGMIGDPA